MIGVLSLALVLVQGPHEVPALRDAVGWAVPVEVGGVKLSSFLLWLNRSTNLICKASTGPNGVSMWDGQSEGLAVGDWHAGSFPFQIVDTNMRVAALPVCGFLGLDALSKTAVGFDKTTGTIAIWPGGKLSAKEAGEWVTSGAPWPGDSAKPTVWQGDLAFDAQGLPCVEGTIGGKAVSFRIVGYGNALSVPSGDVGSLEFEKLRWPGQSADICLTSGVQVGPERPWTLFTAADTVDGMEPEKPVVPINAFASRRVLLDCAAGRIYAQRLGLRAQAALAFSPLLPAHLEGAVPCVGPCREFPNPDGPRSTKYEGDALLSCFGLDDKAIVELLSVETRLDAEQLKKLASALNGPPLVRLMHEGKVVEIGK